MTNDDGQRICFPGEVNLFERLVQVALDIEYLRVKLVARCVIRSEGNGSFEICGCTGPFIIIMGLQITRSRKCIGRIRVE